MIRAVLSNPAHPEYGVATIPFPIPHDQYAHCMELMEALEIGDAVKADCKVQAIDSFYTVLKRTEMLTVNVEELNYLAKRLDSFDTGEAAQFQAMAHKLELFKLKDLINLTFCCQQATVITSFSDLAAIGRDHYMNLHGGSARVDELEALDGEETARRLIEDGNGTITPYGVVYDNGMKLEQVYNGQSFPCYYYEPSAITIAVTAKSEPEDTEHITWLFLSMTQEEIDRALLRAGITAPSENRQRMVESHLPDEVDVLLDMEQESLADLNALAQVADALSADDLRKLGAVVTMAKPQNAEQIKNLAENLDQFDFAPDAHTPAEYGKYMIQQSGHFDYDENLDGFYDYGKYGLQRMSEEEGVFTDRGYIAYKGYDKIGRSMREGEGGVLTPHGYVMQESELRQAPPNLGRPPRKPPYMIYFLCVSDIRAVKLYLPAKQAELDAVLNCLEVDSWQEVRLEDRDAAMPEMWLFTDLAYDSMEQVNRFAQCLAELDMNRELVKFKAVADQLDIRSLDDALALAEHLSEYALEPGIHSLEELAREELSVIVSDPDRDLLTRHLNMEAYGADLLWRDQGLFSDYGYICRPDGQPLQVPRQGVDMTMQ